MKVEAFLADAIDTLASGKLVALGLYTDRVVVLTVSHDAPEPSKELPYAVNLALALCISDIPKDEHEHGIELRLELPNGDTLGDGRGLSRTFVGKQGDSVNVIVPLTPLLAPALGTYWIISTVDGTEYRLPFELRVRRGEPPRPAQ